MGILNVTPDSFSDGGLHLEIDHAIKYGLALAADGADIVDVGGESTRPNADRTSEADERARVLPVIAALSTAGVKVSIDTMRSGVAAAAIEAGAEIVNDVSGGLADPEMAHVVADADVQYVAMHWRAHSREMQEKADYRDVVGDVVADLQRRLDALTGAGISPERIALDPGLGFAKTAGHNWKLLRRLDALIALGQPVLVGASRKSFLGALLTDGNVPRPPMLRDDATAAVSALAAAAGASCVRVHNVRSSLDAVRVTAAWCSEV
ncbi:dihydropteroate synthase [Streptomyces sp. NPDC057474]|uniref:dihydropteroate synthase n=1 Tax=Streptomyces sp. NPDC057474 TaxID=3346144 RepID=UPI0036B67B57